jgi:hypothetical protein
VLSKIHKELFVHAKIYKDTQRKKTKFPIKNELKTSTGTSPKKIYRCQVSI